MPSTTSAQSVSGYLFILGTVALTVYGQLVVKWQVRRMGALPADPVAAARFMGQLLVSPWVASSVVAAFAAFLLWTAALTKFELSYAYPFTSLSFVLVLAASVWLFQESVTAPKVIGLVFIVAGIIISSRA